MLLSMISSFVWGRPGNVWTCQSHVNRVKITHEPMQPSRVLYTEYENFHLVRRRITHRRSWMAWKQVTYSKSQFYDVDVTNGKTAKRRWLNSHFLSFLNPSSILHFLCQFTYLINSSAAIAPYLEYGSNRTRFRWVSGDCFILCLVFR
jgi:hypothetical protein